MKTAGSFGEEDVLRLAAALEKGSEHPLAEAIVEGASERGIDPPAVTDFQSHTGKGVSGTVENRKVVLGNKAMLKDIGAD